MDLGHLPDIVHSDLINLEDVPDKALEVLALRALSLSAAKIARITKMKKTNVESYIERYDPHGLCKVTAEQKRVITTTMLMGVGVEALTEVTEDKLKGLDADTCTKIAARCVSTAEKIRAIDKGLHGGNEGPSRIQSMMDSLESAEVEEG